MTTPEYYKVNEWLIRWIPELEDRYEKEFEWWGNEVPSAHVVYGDILTPHMISLLTADEADHDTEQLERIFGLLEEMAASPNEDVRDVVRVTICWDLVGRTVPYERAKLYMGPQTRKLCTTTEPYKTKEP